MKFDPQKIIEELMKNSRIKARVEETKLTKDQIFEALPILIDMNQQKDNKETKYLTSFYIDKNGQIRRQEYRSTYWAKFAYLENIKSLWIEEVDFEDDKEFIQENSRKIVVNQVVDYLNKSKQTKGLYLYGDTGVGKTFLMKRIARKIAQNESTVAFITVANLVSKIAPMFRDKDDDNYAELINLLKKVDFLFLDDIGSEQIKSWFRDGFLLQVLDERYKRARTTFFSSNYSQVKLESIQAKTNYKYQEKEKAAKLLSRIRGLSNEVRIKSFKKQNS